MRQPFLIGEKVYLRTLEESDIGEEYLGGLNDAEGTRYLETGKFPSTPETLRRYLDPFRDSTTDLALAIEDPDTARHITNVTLNRINWIHPTVAAGP